MTKNITLLNPTLYPSLSLWIESLRTITYSTYAGIISNRIVFSHHQLLSKLSNLPDSIFQLHLMRPHTTAMRNRNLWPLQSQLMLSKSQLMPHPTPRSSVRVINSDYPHLLSPQFKQVKQPSITMLALVLHFLQSDAPFGKPSSFISPPDFAFFSRYSAFLSSTSFC